MIPQSSRRINHKRTGEQHAPCAIEQGVRQLADIFHSDARVHNKNPRDNPGILVRVYSPSGFSTCSIAAFFI